ncbi:MAG: flagellar biosynthetic protein FliQ [Planctomycetaceae bacterium]
MSPDLATDLLRDALLTVLVLASPVLVTMFLASFITTLLQSLTSLQDATLSMTPRLIIGGFVTLALLPWMLDRLTEYSTDLYQGILTRI